jgi:hypothetical protein
VTGAPRGFTPSDIGAGACPAADPAGYLCADPIYALGSTYSLSLPAGKWRVDGFYEINPFGGAFVGPSVVVTVKTGATITRDFTVPYSKPATLKGTVTVTKVPTGFAVEAVTVLLCPAGAPYTGGQSYPLDCVQSYGTGGSGVTGSYDITGLPSGPWTAYPGFCSNFGCSTNAKAGVAVTLTPGATTKADLTTPFLIPGEGLVTGTIKVTGAPSTFNDPVGFYACQASAGQCESGSVSGNTFQLLVPDGTWTLTGLYEVPPFYNAVLGHTETVVVKGGKITTVTLTVPYQRLGTATGTIDVTGVPAHVAITTYTVTACPSGSSPELGAVSCVYEYSGAGGFGEGVADPAKLAGVAHPKVAETPRTTTPINQYKLPTLTAGRWTLYPGYETAFGSYVQPTGTTVTITAGGTTTKDLKLAYQPPTTGLVSGTVQAVDAPENSQAGVEACTAPPTATSCANGLSTYLLFPGDSYQLALPPGTWWVAGFVVVYESNGSIQTTSAPHKVTVVAGSEYKANFAVLVK